MFGLLAPLYLARPLARQFPQLAPGGVRGVLPRFESAAGRRQATG